MIDSVRGDLPELEQVVLLGTPEWEALAAGTAADVELPGCQFDDPINIQYTSRTTGFPKGATLRHNILNNGCFVAEGAAARTSTRARSRSSSTVIRTSPTCRWSACPTSATARS